MSIERPSDLTEESLTKIFRHYFQEPSLNVELHGEKKNEKFIGDKENFQSEINKWTIAIHREGKLPTSLSFIMKTTSGSKFQKFNSRVQRQFFSECFWYKHAFPVLTSIFPEVGSVSPGWYYGFSNYEDSFQPDWWDQHCGALIRQMHHKDEQGLLLLENIGDEKRLNGKPRMFTLDKTKPLSKTQVSAALTSLAIFHGSWWVWLTRQRKAKTQEFETIMNLTDIETAFVKQRAIDPKVMKWFYKPIFKSYIQNLKNHGREEVELKWKNFLKNKVMDPRFFIPEQESSDIRTMIHGDFWVNNMMFNKSDPEDENIEMTMVDFQLMSVQHPARDLWYFLYSSTDRKFRDEHLHKVLQVYHRKISDYWIMEDFKMDYKTFVEEINQYKGTIVAYQSIFIMYICLNPNIVNMMESWTKWKEFMKSFREDVGSMSSEDDHPNLKEFKRRCTEILVELFDNCHI